MSEARNIKKDILYEDNHILVLNKRPSDIVQGDKTKDTPLSEILKEYIKVQYNKPGNVFLGVAHRLDRPVSGAVVFAKTSKALVRLNEMLRDKKLEKTYWAVVEQRPEMENGNLVQFMRKDQEKNKSFVVNEKTKGALRAELNYKLINASDNFNLLEIKLITGRHHQIRAQLAKIGCPIKGDLKYGYKRSNSNASIHLHSRMLEFIHPVKKTPIKIIAPPPDEPLWNHFLANVGGKTENRSQKTEVGRKSRQ
ncbi:MAG: RluA family pseudouridine synthase [Bacteroidetes bacterium]|nr:RluA family pseudouridine synthase [Bacteroidota bacterium]